MKMSKSSDSDGETRIKPSFDRSTDGRERANALAEELGWPEDNQLVPVLKSMREEYGTWKAVFDELDEAYDVVDKVASEEMDRLIPDWEIAVVVPDETATSGERYKTYTRTAETVEEAEEMVESFTGHRVVTERSKQVGSSRVI